MNMYHSFISFLRVFFLSHETETIFTKVCLLPYVWLLSHSQLLT